MNGTGTRCASNHGLDQVLVDTEFKKRMKLKWMGTGQARSEGMWQKRPGLEGEMAKSVNTAAHIDPEPQVLHP